MGTKLEVFECSIFINALELESFKPKRMFVRFQVSDMPQIDIASFDVTDGTNRINLYKGVQYFMRTECMSTFKTCPLFVYFYNQQSQVICACGFDMSPLIVDAFRHSHPENLESEVYPAMLVLQNRYDQKIGLAHFEFTCRHFSSDFSRVQCFEEFFDEKKSEQEQEITEELQLVENTRANANTMTRRIQKKREKPISVDLLKLSKKYQRSRSGLVDEVMTLEEQVRKIEAIQKMPLHKKRQINRRKFDGFEPSPGSTSSTHTSDFSFFENSSDYSNSQAIQDTFNKVEQELGKTFSHHKKHHNRHKEHHKKHHHSQKAPNEPTGEVKQDSVPQQAQTCQQPQNKLTKGANTSSKSSHKDYEAFMKRQNEAAERRKSLANINSSTNDSVSIRSQASQSSKLSLKQPISLPSTKQNQNQNQNAQTARPVQNNDIKIPQNNATNSQKTEPNKKQQQQISSATTAPTVQRSADLPNKQTKEKKDIEPKKEKQETDKNVSNSFNDSNSSQKSALSHKSASSQKSVSSQKSASTQKSGSSHHSSHKSPSESSVVGEKSTAQSAIEVLDIPSESSNINVIKSSSSRSSSSHHSNESIEDASTNNVIDIEASSHNLENDSDHKLSFTTTSQIMSKIDDDDFEDIESKTIATNMSDDFVSKNDTENITPSEMQSAISDNNSKSSSTQAQTSSESDRSDKSDKSDKSKPKPSNLDGLDLSELLADMDKDDDSDNMSINSELKNDLGLSSVMFSEDEKPKKEYKEEPKAKPKEKTETKKPPPKEEKPKEEKSVSHASEPLSDLKSVLDSDLAGILSD